MTRHTRSKQLIKLAMMQGEDVKFAKWNYSPGHNLTIEYARKIDNVIDTSFRWKRTRTLRIGNVHHKLNYRHRIKKRRFKFLIFESKLTFFTKETNYIAFRHEKGTLQLRVK